MTLVTRVYKLSGKWRQIELDAKQESRIKCEVEGTGAHYFLFVSSLRIPLARGSGCTEGNDTQITSETTRWN